MDKLRVKDVISPIDGIFTKMPDYIWGEFIDSEDLDIELYTKYGELLASPLVRFYNENGDLYGLAAHLYRKHSRSWEQMARALYEEYNMFLTSRLHETITNTTEEDITGSKSENRGGETTQTSNNETNNKHKIMGEIKVDGEVVETHDRDDVNTISRNETGTSELDLDKVSTLEIENSKANTSTNNTLNEITSEVNSGDVLTLNKQQETTGSNTLSKDISETGGIGRTTNNNVSTNEIINDEEITTFNSKNSLSGQDKETISYNSGESGGESTNKTGQEKHNITENRTPNLIETDDTTITYGKTVTNSGKQINDASEQTFGFGSSEPADVSKSKNIREDQNLKETNSGTDQHNVSKKTTGTDKTTKEDSLTFLNRKDSTTFNRNKTGSDSNTYIHGKVESKSGNDSIQRNADNTKTVIENGSEDEERDIRTLESGEETISNLVSDTGTENRETTSNESRNENSTTQVTENLTESGTNTTNETGTETTTTNNSITGKDSLKQTGTVKNDSSQVTKYDGYEEDTVNNSSGSQITNMNEDLTGNHSQKRTLTNTQETNREADSPLSTTQSLINEEIEVRMKYNLVDLILESVRKDIALRIWRY